MREHCILNSRAYLQIVAVATQLYIIITSTKEDRKLLVVMTMESRCRTCPVIRKILQSWHGLRTQRERAEPMTEGRLYSLECAPNFQPQKCSLALRLRYLCGVGHSLCSPRQDAPEAHDFLQSSLGHIHGNARGTAITSTQSSESVQANPFLTSERGRQQEVFPQVLSPKSSDYWRILNFSIHSFIQACWWNTSHVLYSVTHPFIHSYIQ